MKKLFLIIFLAGCSSKQVAPVVSTQSSTTEEVQKQEEQSNGTYQELSAPISTPGLDFLGGNKFCDTAIANTPRGWAVGLFATAFGDVRICLEKFCKSGRPSRIRLHTIWNDDHSCNPGQFDSAAKIAASLDPIIAKCGVPGGRPIPVELSGICEGHCSAGAESQLRSRILHAATHAAGYVSAALPPAAIAEAITEIHGDKPGRPSGRYQISFDGNSAFDADVESWKKQYSGAEIQFFWIPSFNGRKGANDNTPREQRTGWPSAEEIQATVDLAQSTIAAPQLPPGFIYKPVSETWGSGHGHPCIITPQNQSISLVDTKGHVIANAQGAGTFAGGGFRAYLPDWGYRLAQKAKQMSGSRATFLRINGKNFGPIDPNRRAGNFR